jgi:Glycosyltransferase family 87
VRALGVAVVAAQAVVLLGPPLLSQDVFGYLSFARLGALHGLNPYTHIPAQAANDPTFGLIGWPLQHSPYGPLFTLASYATAPLGLAGGLWAFKAVAVLASLGTVWLTARATERAGGSAATATALLGLNPVWLVLAVGGAHNDMLLMLALALALLWSAGAHARPGAAALSLAAGVGVKLTAGLVLPFLVLGERGWRERWRIARAALLGLVAVAAIGVIGFGPHVLGFLGAIGEQQEMVATHSIPAETARLFGVTSASTAEMLPSWWRYMWIGLFAAVVLLALWRTARGANWRVAAGWSTLALLLATAWLLPWYAIWVLPLAAVGNDRRLRGAAVLFCAYALLIHLQFASPLLTPRAHRVVPRPAVTRVGKGLEFTGLEVLRHVHLDLHW